MEGLFFLRMIIQKMGTPRGSLFVVRHKPCGLLREGGFVLFENGLPSSMKWLNHILDLSLGW